jgi:hypothetical protein
VSRVDFNPENYTFLLKNFYSFETLSKQVIQNIAEFSDFYFLAPLLDHLKYIESSSVRVSGFTRLLALINELIKNEPPSQTLLLLRNDS